MTVDELIRQLMVLKTHNNETGDAQVWWERYEGAVHTGGEDNGGAVHRVTFSHKNFAHGNQVVLREQ